MKTHYDTLGVPCEADDETIRAALRKAAKEFHPDLNVGDPAGEQHLKQVIAAYEVLRSPKQRAAYDQTLRLRRSRNARHFFTTALVSAGLFSSVVLALVVCLAKPQLTPNPPHGSSSTSAPGPEAHLTAIETQASATKKAVASNDEQQINAKTATSAAEDGKSPNAVLAAEWEQLARRGEPKAILAFAARNAHDPEAELARSWLALLVAATDDIPLLEALHAGGHETVAALALQRLRRLGSAGIARADTPTTSIAKGLEKADPTMAPEFYLARGQLRSKIADLDGAIADFDAFIHVNPHNALAFGCRANAWGAKGDFNRALADFEVAIRLDPTNAAILRDRGILLRRSGAFDGALVDLDQAIRLGFSDAAAYDARGQIWLEKGHYERAIADFNQAIKVDPNFAGAYAHRAVALRGKGDWDRARADFHRAILLDPSLSLAEHEIPANDKQGK